MIPHPFHRMRDLARRMAGDHSGAVAPLLGLLMLVLIGCMGFAVDVGRSMVVKARLVDALDAAGLAVGARASTKDYNADAKRYVSANFRALYAGATVTSVTATPDANKSTIALAATATMPTAFMKLFGIPLVTIKATAEVTRATTGLELAMVLDNTGSMEMSNSMGALKTGATALVLDLFKGQDKADDLYVGLVPFSQAVNIGTSASRKAWVTPTSLLDATNKFYPSTWTGCVEARKSGLDQTDDPPLLTGLFTAYYSPDTAAKVATGEQPNDWIKYRSNGTAYTDIKYTSIYTADQQGPGAFCPQPMTGMTNVKKTITDGITAMTPAGSTFINVGAVWGWRMLSPKWRGYWDGDMAKYNLPLAYGTKNMTKVMLLMTDGENTFTDKFYSAYGYLADNRLNTKTTSGATTALNTRLTNVCTKVKAAGITVITVAYNNPEGDTKSLLQSCATNTSLYFEAANSGQLIEKLKLIGGILSSLRVSK